MTKIMNKILVVDDEKLDLMMVERSFAKLESRINVETCLGSSTAIERITENGIDLVLLDLCMPGLNGFEILEQVKAQPRRSTPVVVVLSTSDHPSDIREAYVKGASAYVVKPTSKEGYRKLAQAICGFWAEQAVLPN